MASITLGINFSWQYDLNWSLTSFSSSVNKDSKFNGSCQLKEAKNIIFLIKLNSNRNRSITQTGSLPGQYGSYFRR